MNTLTITHVADAEGSMQHRVNHMICALQMEMGTSPSEPGQQPNVLFMGGSDVTEVDQDALGRFAVDKNWNILFASFDLADPLAGPVAIHGVVTDGLSQSVVLTGGRLWKKDRRSDTVILFPLARSVLKLSAKGQLLVRPISGPRHDHGYELARTSLASRVAQRPGGVPMMGAVGGLLTIMDTRALTMMLNEA